MKAPTLGDQLAAARNNLARLERLAAQASCAEVGHRWEFTGGCNAGCGPDCSCSVPVHECRCGDCDYGDNRDADAVRAACLAGREFPT